MLPAEQGERKHPVLLRAPENSLARRCWPRWQESQCIAAPIPRRVGLSTADCPPDRCRRRRPEATGQSDLLASIRGTAEGIGSQTTRSAAVIDANLLQPRDHERWFWVCGRGLLVLRRPALPRRHPQVSPADHAQPSHSDNINGSRQAAATWQGKARTCSTRSWQNATTLRTPSTASLII